MFKKIIEKLKSLSKGTWIRTILMFLAIANDVVVAIGKIYGVAVVSEPWYIIVSAILTIVTMLLNYWYNNDWTKLAQAAGEIFDMTKDGDITMDEVTNFIDKHKKPTVNDKEGEEGNTTCGKQ